MRIVCLYLPSRLESVLAHFKEREVPAFFFQGIDAKAAGLITHIPYLLNDPDRGGQHIPASQIGCWLSHLALWRALTLLPDSYFVVAEDDVDLAPDWKQRLDVALHDTPEDFDVLLAGSCCVEDKPKTHISGDVWACNKAFCTHFYVVARKALATLIESQRECYAPIDIALTIYSYPNLKTFVVLPRIAGQRRTDLPP